ncbi:MAG: amidase [Vicinamibacterales bacterium]
MAPLTIDAFARQLRANALSSTEVVHDCLRRIDADNPRLNAFILVMADEALAAAKRADWERANGIDRGPLHGVPISVKDLFDVKGTVTTAASRVRDGIVSSEDAPIVAQLRRSGAVIVGKTNLHEFAFGTTNEDSAFGPARHPLDEQRSPGGSSGGSAISVATGMALASMGTDTGRIESVFRPRRAGWWGSRLRTASSRRQVSCRSPARSIMSGRSHRQ